MTWQSEVTPEQWEEWLSLARRLSRSRKVAPSLGFEDYAAQAMEKLVSQDNRPANVEAWLALTINRQYIDRFRKIQARKEGGPPKDISDERWEREMVVFAVGSPSLIHRRHEFVTEVLSVLKEKEREILIMAAAGFDNHEIADHLGYGSNKIVATRLKQIQLKVRTELHQVGTDYNN